MTTAEQIFAAASGLSSHDKWVLVTRLWESLPPEAWEPPSAAHLAEVQRRSAEFDAGDVEPIHKDEVLRRLREKLTGNG